MLHVDLCVRREMAQDISQSTRKNQKQGQRATALAGTQTQAALAKPSPPPAGTSCGGCVAGVSSLPGCGHEHEDGEHDVAHHALPHHVGVDALAEHLGGARAGGGSEGIR